MNNLVLKQNAAIRFLVSLGLCLISYSHAVVDVSYKQSTAGEVRTVENNNQQSQESIQAGSSIVDSSYALIINPNDADGYAADVPSNTKAYRIMTYLFGTMDNSEYGAIICAPPNPCSSLMGRLFATLNSGILTLGILFLAYTIAHSSFSDAAQGTALGQKFSAPEIAFRSAVGLSFLIPTSSGYSVIQIAIVRLVLLGSSAGTGLWQYLVDYRLAANEALGSAHLYDNQSMSALGGNKSAQDFVELFSEIETCVLFENHHITNIDNMMVSELYTDALGHTSIRTGTPNNSTGYNNACGQLNLGTLSSEEINLVAQYMNQVRSVAANMSSEYFNNKEQIDDLSVYQDQYFIVKDMMRLDLEMLTLDQKRAELRAASQQFNGDIYQSEWLDIPGYFFQFLTTPGFNIQVDLNPALGTSPNQVYRQTTLNAYHAAATDWAVQADQNDANNMGLDFQNVSGTAFFKADSSYEVTRNLQEMFESVKQYQDPLIGLAAYGRYWLDVAMQVLIAAFVFGLVVSVATGVASDYVSSSQMGIGMAFIGLITAVLQAFGGIIPIASMFAIGLPMMPLIMFSSAIIAWIIYTIAAVMSGPIIAIGLISPGGGLGKAAPALMLILNLFLRPCLHVIGLVAGAKLFNIAFLYFTQAFLTTVYQIFEITSLPHDGKLMSLTSIIFLYAYTFAISALCSRCYGLINLIPDRVFMWVGAPPMGIPDTVSQGSRTALQRSASHAEQKAGEVSKGVDAAIKEKQNEALGKIRKREKDNIGPRSVRQDLQSGLRRAEEGFFNTLDAIGRFDPQVAMQQARHGINRRVNNAVNYFGSNTAERQAYLDANKAVREQQRAIAREKREVYTAAVSDLLGGLVGLAGKKDAVQITNNPLNSSTDVVHFEVVTPTKKPSDILAELKDKRNQALKAYLQTDDAKFRQKYSYMSLFDRAVVEEKATYEQAPSPSLYKKLSNEFQVALLSRVPYFVGVAASMMGYKNQGAQSITGSARKYLLDEAAEQAPSRAAAKTLSSQIRSYFSGNETTKIQQYEAAHTALLAQRAERLKDLEKFTQDLRQLSVTKERTVNALLNYAYERQKEGVQLIKEYDRQLKSAQRVYGLQGATREELAEHASLGPLLKQLETAQKNHNELRDLLSMHAESLSGYQRFRFELDDRFAFVRSQRPLEEKIVHRPLSKEALAEKEQEAKLKQEQEDKKYQEQRAQQKDAKKQRHLVADKKLIQDESALSLENASAVVLQRIQMKNRIAELENAKTARPEDESFYVKTGRLARLSVLAVIYPAAMIAPSFANRLEGTIKKDREMVFGDLSLALESRQIRTQAYINTKLNHMQGSVASVRGAFEQMTGRLEKANKSYEAASQHHAIARQYENVAQRAFDLNKKVQPSLSSDYHQAKIRVGLREARKNFADVKRNLSAQGQTMAQIRQHPDYMKALEKLKQSEKELDRGNEAVALLRRLDRGLKDGSKMFGESMREGLKKDFENYKNAKWTQIADEATLSVKIGTRLLDAASFVKLGSWVVVRASVDTALRASAGAVLALPRAFFRPNHSQDQYSDRTIFAFEQVSLQQKDYKQLSVSIPGVGTPLSLSYSNDANSIARSAIDVGSSASIAFSMMTDMTGVPMLSRSIAAYWKTSLPQEQRPSEAARDSTMSMIDNPLLSARSSREQSQQEAVEPASAAATPQPTRDSLVSETSEAAQEAHSASENMMTPPTTPRSSLSGRNSDSDGIELSQIVLQERLTLDSGSNDRFSEMHDSTKKPGSLASDSYHQQGTEHDTQRPLSDLSAGQLGQSFVASDGTLLSQGQYRDSFTQRPTEGGSHPTAQESDTGS